VSFEPIHFQQSNVMKCHHATDPIDVESMAVVMKDKFDIHLTKSMSCIAAEKSAELIEI
jgi:hypothetical protein